MLHLGCDLISSVENAPIICPAGEFDDFKIIAVALLSLFSPPGRRPGHVEPPLIDRIQPSRDYLPPRDYPPYRDDYGRYPPPRDVRYPYDYPPPPPRDYRRPPSPPPRDAFPPAPPSTTRAIRDYDDVRYRGAPPAAAPPSRYDSRRPYYPPDVDMAPPTSYPPRGYPPPPSRDYYDRYERPNPPPDRYPPYAPPPSSRPRTPPAGGAVRPREEYERDRGGRSVFLDMISHQPSTYSNSGIIHLHLSTEADRRLLRRMLHRVILTTHLVRVALKGLPGIGGFIRGFRPRNTLTILRLVGAARRVRHLAVVRVLLTILRGTLPPRARRRTTACRPRMDIPVPHLLQLAPHRAGTTRPEAHATTTQATEDRKLKKTTKTNEAT